MNCTAQEEMYCPICDTVHKVTFLEKSAKAVIKNVEVSYIEKVFVCDLCDEDNEFVTPKLMNENLLFARDAYREKKGLLTSSNIAAIRKKYGLTQSELALLLGWGEITITRYETKQIQDEAHDGVLRQIKDDPSVLYDFLSKNRGSFSEKRYSEIKATLIKCIDTDGIEFAEKRLLLDRYKKYDTPSELNGFTVLNTEKILAVITYFASRMECLYKVKLMKLLWYADILYYKRYGTSLTGIVYLHEQHGALPEGHNEILRLKGSVISEEETGESVRTKILPNENYIDYAFTAEEKNVLDTVIAKFKNYTGKNISEYMHKEKAYINTVKNEPISFEWAKYLNEF